MNVPVRKLLLGSIVVTVVAFITAGIAGNHHSGARAVIGDTAWFVFMIGMLVVLVLAVIVIVQALLRRSRRSGTA